MEPVRADEDLVVATPELVAFDYQVAGLGTRIIAQLIDVFLLFLALIAIIAVAVAVASTVRDVNLVIIVVVVGYLLVVFGYFWLFEALWSGQTLGKRAFRLRVVGDHGEPITFTQAAVRNLIRLVDWLPSWYGIGLVALFIEGHGKRLGDLAAGTIVVKDSDRISLHQLSATVRHPVPGAAPAAHAREERLRRLDPDLRRFVSSYAMRRHTLSSELRAQLATTVEAQLRVALPEVVAARGALAALDELATLAS